MVPKLVKVYTPSVGPESHSVNKSSLLHQSLFIESSPDSFITIYPTPEKFYMQHSATHTEMETTHYESHQNSQMLRAPHIATLPLPSAAYSGETPHSILTYEDLALVNYDLRRHPYDARPRYPHLVRLIWWYESAIHPAVSTLTLICGILPQPVVVTPSHSGFEFVIVRDVLLAVHEAYQVTVNQYHGTATTSDSDPSFLREHSTVLTRHMWGGISEQTAPGEWRVHIE